MTWVPERSKRLGCCGAVAWQFEIGCESVSRGDFPNVSVAIHILKNAIMLLQILLLTRFSKIHAGLARDSRAPAASQPTAHCQQLSPRGRQV
jgi:hypothetical protein